MFKKIAATILASLSIATPGPVLANEIEDHQYLWETVEHIGVQRFINHPKYCSKFKEYSGLYDSNNNVLVICQDEARQLNGEMVGWTDNDLDTLRHEAHHIVQDCASGTIHDAELVTLFDGDELEQFVLQSGLTPEKLRWIASSYRSELNASDDVILMEFEAFAVAASINPRTIADKLLEFCV